MDSPSSSKNHYKKRLLEQARSREQRPHNSACSTDGLCCTGPVRWTVRTSSLDSINLQDHVNRTVTSDGVLVMREDMWRMKELNCLSSLCLVKTYMNHLNYSVSSGKLWRDFCIDSFLLLF